MSHSLRPQFADQVDLNGLEDAYNPVISVDHDGNVLSRLRDRRWLFASKSRPKCRISVDWPEESEPNTIEAKQLAHLCLTHGKVVAPVSIQRRCKTVASLAVFCANRGIAFKTLQRHPLVATDFINSNTGSRNDVIAIARLALAFGDTLGWTLLEADQIAGLELIRPTDRHQYPVIPLRIHSELDDVAHAILSGYLAVAAQLDDVCETWGRASYRKRKTTANWQNLLSQRPLMSLEISKWAGNAIQPLPSYFYTIRSAALWVIAAGSCARRGEILSLRRGCLTRELHGNTVAYLLSGETTKTQNNPNAIWVVSPRVEQAVRVLERLLDWYERAHPNPPYITDRLFQVFDFNLGRRLSPSRIRQGKRQHGESITSLELSPISTAADTSITEDDWAEAKCLTPDLDERKFSVGANWVPSPHQLRRTGMVYAAASGLVSRDSMSFQAKHDSWKMTDHYCKNFWHLRITDPDNPLVVGTRQSDAEEFTRIYADAYNQARSIAKQDDRFFTAYGREHKRSILSEIPLLSLDEIRTGLAYKVLKRNTLGLCAQSDFCEWQKALTVRGCMTKADGHVCAKAIIDAGREGELQALQKDLSCQLESLHARDTFAREQLEADIAATASAIAMIEQHQRGQDAEA